ncbi:Pro-interleukin-16 [Zootermopsis nevadensis]|uniref:Pro-interleukin-16 n=2 Tax=Zootermopsis nevadensis TaxID=136037 RepID=A0A067R3Q4_ZOONE|nr:Pro-interleukin-16 [Zootermopsis nevadensis]
MFSAAGDAPTPRRRFSSSEDICVDPRSPRPPPPESLPKKTPAPTIDRTRSSLDLSHLSGVYTLPRKPAGSARPSALTHTASLHTRSQSLIDIGRGSAEDVRKASLNALIEQRRRGISKLRGLVIPEKVSEVVSPSHPICDLPEIRSRDSILTTNKAPPTTSLQRASTTNRWSTEQTTASSAPQLVIPSPPWKSSSSANNLPKYSPAFKRKSFTVCASGLPGREELQSLFPVSRQSAEPPESLESITSPTRSDLSFEYKLSTASKSPSAPGRRPAEDDSDNDSAVSSSRSSISPPPTPPPPPLLSPLRRTLSSETTVSAASSTTSTLTCGSSDSNRRVLKAQSVEAINRKNVLSSARYSSGRDLKVGSPLIQRKFDEDERVAYLVEVEGHADAEEEEDVEKLPEEQPPAKPLPAPRHVPVPPKPEQRKLQEASPEEETDLLSVLTEGRGSQMRRQRAKDSVLGDSRRSVSVNDIRKAFEKAEMALANSGRKVNHARVSSLDSTASEDSFTPHYGSVGNLHREQFGSVTSVASSTSLISPQELQLLIDEANQPLEDSVSTTAIPVHDVVVVVLHREGTTGSVGITLAGGADYEAKEITVHKVLAGSPADRDGRIQKGDRILSINGRSMKGVTHHESLNILKAPRPEVVLVVSRSRVLQDGSHNDPQLDECPVVTHIPRPSRPPRIPEQPVESLTNPLVAAEEEDRGPPLTIMLTKDGAGLGFSLEGGIDSPLGDKPLTIKKIFTGGSAEKNGRLRAGDELLSVNGSDVTILSRIEAWGLMKRLPDGPVALAVRHRLNK